MREYVDLQKVLPTSLFTLVEDLEDYPGHSSKERAARLQRSVQIMVVQFQKLVFMGLAEKIDRKYRRIKSMDSKVNYINN